MVATSMVSTVQQLRHWAAAPGGDDELLRRFAEARDEAAFAELVRRHGALVLNVARGVLGEHHAAEDVLQATFLLLARKAWRVRWRRSVAPWLHAAAYRIACEARRRHARRPEPLTIDIPGEQPPERPLLWQEVRGAVDEELARLSASLRAPLVLCYLQGLTRDEAALRLGWSLARLKRRLERGRALLRERLERRGIAWGAMAALLAANDSVSSDVVRDVTQVAAGGAIPARVATLLGGPGRWRRAAAVLLVLTVGIGGAALAMRPADPPAPAKPAKVDRVEAAREPLPEGAVARLGTTLLSPGQLVKTMAFSPDGKRLAVWIQPWGGTTSPRLQIIDTATGGALREVVRRCALVNLTWLPDGRGLAVVRLKQKGSYLWEFTDEKTDLPPGEFNDIVPIDAKHAFSPDGRWLLVDQSRSDERPLELREVVANSPVDNLKSHRLANVKGYISVVFSADSRRVFVLQRERKPGLPPQMSGSSDGIRDMLVSARVTVYDVATRKEQNSFEVWGPLMGTVAVDPPRLALSPDGKKIYVGADTGTVHAYDTASGRELASFEPNSPADPKRFQVPGVRSLALSPDGRMFYSVGPAYSLSAVDLTAAKPSSKVFDPGQRVEQVVVSPDGQRVAVSAGARDGRVALLDAKTGADLLPRPGHKSMIDSIAVTADGTVVTAGLDRTICWWDVERGRELRRKRLDADIGSRLPPMLTSDGRGLFAIVDGDNISIVYIDLDSGKTTTVASASREHRVHLVGAGATSVFFTTEEGKTRQWDAATGREGRTIDGAGTVSMAPDGSNVVMLSHHYERSGDFGYYKGSRATFFDPKTGKPTRNWQTDECRWESAAWSADGRHVVAVGLPMTHRGNDKPSEFALPFSAKSGVVLFDGRTGDTVRAFDPASGTEHGPYMVSAVAFAPDGKRVAIGQLDGSVHVYERDTGRVMRSFRGHRNQVSKLAFAADGRRLISVSYDMTGLVWDVSSSAAATPGGK